MLSEHTGKKLRIKDTPMQAHTCDLTKDSFFHKTDGSTVLITFDDKLFCTRNEPLIIDGNE